MAVMTPYIENNFWIDTQPVFTNHCKKNWGQFAWQNNHINNHFYIVIGGSLIINLDICWCGWYSFW